MTKFKSIIFEKNVTIHCPEEWMANELLKYADSKGYKWKSGYSYKRCNHWNNHKYDTCYYLYFGVYSDIESFEMLNCKILHYNDVVIKEKNEIGEIMKHKKVIFSGDVTIVIWEDNTKTIVKCSDGDVFDKEKGYLMALFQKLTGFSKKKSSNFFKDIVK